MIDLRAFIVLEQTLATAMRAVWEPRAQAYLDDLQHLLDLGRYTDAHAYADMLTMKGVVSEAFDKIEELLVSGFLFGAHHAAGGLKAVDTELPEDLNLIIPQLEIMIEQDATAFVVLAAKQMIAKAEAALHPLAKADKKSLYIHRPLEMPEALLAWAKAQGFKSTLPPEDLHVTLCYSKAPVDWDTISKISGPAISIGGARTVERFGDAVVLTFQSSGLQKRNAHLSAKGCKSDFPEYRPHVTISYDPTIDVTQIEPFQGTLMFGPEEWAEIEGAGWSKDDLVEHVLKSVTRCGCEEHGLTYTPSTLRKDDYYLPPGALNDAVMGTGKKLIDIGANLTTSRVIQYGFLSQAAKKKISTYVVNEVLDEKTCPVCILMHGREFKVEHELSKLKQAFTTPNPKDLKTVAPWPGQDKATLKHLADATSEELQSEGLGGPPYHPNCRGVLSLVGTTTLVHPELAKLAQQLGMKKADHLQKFNQNHEPAGSSKGGQFSSGKPPFKDMAFNPDYPLYHGTKSLDHVLSKGFQLGKPNVGNKFGEGVYFTHDPEAAAQYGDVVELDPKLVGKMKDFSNVDDADFWKLRYGEEVMTLANKLAAEAGVVPKQPEDFSPALHPFGPRALTQILQAQGYDSLFYPAEGIGGTVVIFDPARINGKVKPYKVPLKKFNPHHMPAGSPKGGQFTSADMAGTLADKAALASHLDTLTPEEILANPTIAKAVEALYAIPVTSKKEGYGTPVWWANREFNFKGEKVIGLTAAMQRLYEGAIELGGGEVKTNKQAYIVVGPPAAGKSTIAEKLARKVKAAIVDADEAKAVLPEYAGGLGANAVHDESGDIMHEVLGRFANEGKNILLPKVGAKKESLDEIIDALKIKGYDVHIVNMKVSVPTAMRRMVGRFLKTGRIINPNYLLKVVGDNPSHVFDELKHDARISSFANLDGEVPFGVEPKLIEGAGHVGQIYKPHLHAV